MLLNIHKAFRLGVRGLRPIHTTAGCPALCVGDEVTQTRTFTAQDVQQFAKLTGDTNPIHTDQEQAEKLKLKRTKHDSSPIHTDQAEKRTGHQGCMVHGALLNGAVSALIGTRMPGPGTLVAHQELHFPNPCLVGEEVLVAVRVEEARKITKVSFSCTTIASQRVVLRGTAKLIAPHHNQE